MKNTILAILALLLTLSLVYIGISNSKDDPRIQQLEDQIERLEEKSRYDSIRIEEADSAAAEIASQKDSLLQRLEQRESARSRSTDSAISEITDQRVRAEVTAAVEEERAEHQSTVKRLVGYFDSRDAARLRQISARDSLISSLQQTITVKDQLIEEYEAKLAPTIDLGFLSFDLGCQPGAQVNVNPQGRVDLGVGVNCGVPL